MSIKKVNIIVEGRMSKEKKEEFKKSSSSSSKKSFKYFENNTEDQFPYIEAAIAIMDSNLKWWQKNWEDIQSKIEEILPKAAEQNFEHLKGNKIKTHFVIYTGKDPKSPDVKYTGPAIEYIFINSSNAVVRSVMKLLDASGLVKGHKMFVEDNTLTIMF